MARVTIATLRSVDIEWPAADPHPHEPWTLLMNPGAAIAIGVGVGAAIGVATDNLSVGVGIGATIGAVFAFALSRRDTSSGNEPDD